MPGGWLSRWLRVKESTCQCRRHRFDPWVGKIPWRKREPPERAPPSASASPLVCPSPDPAPCTQAGSLHQRSLPARTGPHLEPTAPQEARLVHCPLVRTAPISSSRGSSQPRDQNHVSCIAGRFFTTGPPGKPHVPACWKNKESIGRTNNFP